MIVNITANGTSSHATGNTDAISWMMKAPVNAMVPTAKYLTMGFLLLTTLPKQYTTRHNPPTTTGLKTIKASSNMIAASQRSVVVIYLEGNGVRLSTGTTSVRIGRLRSCVRPVPNASFLRYRLAGTINLSLRYLAACTSIVRLLVTCYCKENVKCKGKY